PRSRAIWSRMVPTAHTPAAAAAAMQASRASAKPLPRRNFLMCSIPFASPSVAPVYGFAFSLRHPPPEYSPRRKKGRPFFAPAPPHEMHDLHDFSAVHGLQEAVVRGYHANHANHAKRSDHAGYRNHANHAKRSDHTGHRNHANHADHAGHAKVQKTVRFLSKNCAQKAALAHTAGRW